MEIDEYKTHVKFVHFSEKVDLMREGRRLLKANGHEHILGLIGVVQEQNYYALVLEYMHFKNVYRFITTYKGKLWPGLPKNSLCFITDGFECRTSEQFLEFVEYHFIPITLL